MKKYGAFKSTEFSRKQINAIFSAAKNGSIKVEKWFISELYTLADFLGYDDNRSVELSEKQVLIILEKVFAKNYIEAQELIDKTSDDWFNSFSLKNQAKCNRHEFVC